MTTKFKISLALVMAGAYILVSCTKQTPEQAFPSAHSGFSKAQVLAEANAWCQVDKTNRAVGAPEPSGSMLRVFDSSSYLLLEKVDSTTPLRVGNIYAYKNPNLTTNEISHRLIQINSDGTLVFKGDNNTDEDPPVDRSAVVSQVVGILYTDGINYTNP